MNKHATNGIDAAVAKAAQAAPMPGSFNIALSSGRNVEIRIPLDATVIDILELTAKVAGQLPVAIAQVKNRPSSRLVIPG